MATAQGLRRHDRHPLSGRVWLSWEQDGGVRQVACKGLDISAGGMRLSSTDPLPIRNYVNFRIHGTPFAGTGSIRSCSHDRMRYLVGIEFGQGIRWDPEKHPLEAPAQR